MMQYEVGFFTQNNPHAPIAALPTSQVEHGTFTKGEAVMLGGQRFTILGVYHSFAQNGPDFTCRRSIALGPFIAPLEGGDDFTPWPW